MPEPCSLSLSLVHNTELYYQSENQYKERVLFARLLDYYTKTNPDLLQVIEGFGTSSSSRLSLRRLDAIVSKNSHGNLCYFIPVSSAGGGKEKDKDAFHNALKVETYHVPFNMVASYVQQLHHYQKRYFDAFRRRTKVKLLSGRLQTSYCQLNFFKWVHESRLLKHLETTTTTDKNPKQQGHHKNRDCCQDLVLFVAPQYIPNPFHFLLHRTTTPRKKLVLSVEFENQLLERSLMLYKTPPLPPTVLQFATVRKRL